MLALKLKLHPNLLIKSQVLQNTAHLFHLNLKLQTFCVEVTQIKRKDKNRNVQLSLI
jgi:hypothetical protein